MPNAPRPSSREEIEEDTRQADELERYLDGITYRDGVAPEDGRTP